MFPIGTLLAATAGHPRPAGDAARRRRPGAAMPDCPTFDGFTDLIGLPEIRELEARFGTP